MYYVLDEEGRQLATYVGMQTADATAKDYFTPTTTVQNPNRSVYFWAGEYNSYTGATPSVRYTSTAAGWRKEYPIGDHLGSTRIVLSPDVVPILSRTDYEPFGRPLQTQSPANPQRLSWIGKENDVESSLGDFGARKYDPELGRFTSVDPLWEEMPGSSPFHYCFNNPVMMRDPFGLEPDGFQDQLTNVEYGDDDEEPSPIKAGKSQSQRDQEQAIRERKNEWKLQMAQREAADKAGLKFDHLTMQFDGSVSAGALAVFDAKSVSFEGKYDAITVAGVQVGTDENRISYMGKAGNIVLTRGASLGGPLPLIGYSRSTVKERENKALARTISVESNETIFVGIPFIALSGKIINRNGYKSTFIGITIGGGIGLGLGIQGNIEIGANFTSRASYYPHK